MTARSRKLIFFSLVVLCLSLGFYLLIRPGKTYQVASGNPEGSYLTFVEGLDLILSKEKRPIQLIAKETSGSVENLQLLKSGEADFALIQNGLRGDSPISVVAQLYQEVVHILLPENSTITGLEQLRGKRVCTGLPESGTRVVAGELLTHYGLVENDFTPLSLSPKNSAIALLAGEADAMILVTALRAPVIEDLLATGKVKFLTLGSPEQTGNISYGIHEHFPHLQPFVIPQHAYASQSKRSAALPENPVSALSVSSLLVCRKELPDRVIRRLTKALFTNRDSLIQTSPDTKNIEELGTKDVFPYPIHPGAESYYQRKSPGFLRLYADLMAFLLTALATMIGFISWFRRWRSKQRKSRIDVYYSRVNRVLQELYSENDPDLDTEEKKLRSLNYSAFQDLINEKLKADESFSIFQSLLEEGLKEIQWRRDRLES